MGAKAGGELQRWEAALALGGGVRARGRGHRKRLNSVLQDRSPCHFTAFWHSRGNTLAPHGKQSACWPDSRSIFCSGSSSRARIVLHRPPHWSLYQTLRRQQKQTEEPAECAWARGRPPPCPVTEPTGARGAARAWPPAAPRPGTPPPHRAPAPTPPPPCYGSPGPEKMPELGHEPTLPCHRYCPCDAHRPPSITSFFDLGQGHGIKVATRRQTWAVRGVCTYRASRSC